MKKVKFRSKIFFFMFIHVLLLLLGGPSMLEKTKPKDNVPHCMPDRFVESFDLKHYYIFHYLVLFNTGFLRVCLP
jgi:hypothetical protein